MKLAVLQILPHQVNSVLWVFMHIAYDKIVYLQYTQGEPGVLSTAYILCISTVRQHCNSRKWLGPTQRHQPNRDEEHSSVLYGHMILKSSRFLYCNGR